MAQQARNDVKFSMCPRELLYTPKMGEIRLTSNPTLKGPLFSETGQCISFATI